MLVRRNAFAGSAEIVRLDEGGPVLGLLDNSRYRAGTIQTQPSNTLLLYSDGITIAHQTMRVTQYAARPPAFQSANTLRRARRLASMSRPGMRHIAEGTDHLPFLITLLMRGR
jgi:hypothetical protein